MAAAIPVLGEARIGQIEFVPRTGNADVEEPSRLLLLKIRFGAPVGNRPLIHSH